MTRNQFNEQSSLVAENLSLVSCNHFKSLPFFIVHSEKYPAFTIRCKRHGNHAGKKSKCTQRTLLFFLLKLMQQLLCHDSKYDERLSRMSIVRVLGFCRSFVCYLMVNRSEKLFAVIQFVSTSCLEIEIKRIFIWLLQKCNTFLILIFIFIAILIVLSHEI